MKQPKRRVDSLSIPSTRHRRDTRLTHRFHATKVSVMEATRACPYAFPKKIQEEYDRLADEQMQKLKELARRDSLLSSD